MIPEPQRSLGSSTEEGDINFPTGGMHVLNLWMAFKGQSEAWSRIPTICRPMGPLESACPGLCKTANSIT